MLFTYDGSSRAAGLKLYVNGELQKVTVLKDNLSKSIRVDGTIHHRLAIDRTHHARACGARPLDSSRTDRRRGPPIGEG